MAECPDNNQSLTASDPPVASSSIINVDNNNVNGIVGISTPLFDINKMLRPTTEYMALNSLVNEMLGYEARWFRAIPQQRSKDVFFQEYTLSNVEETPICLKVIIPGGNMPDSKYDFDLMGLTYEIPLEIQIDKKYWEKLVGFGTAPQKKDIVYLAMPNKLYEVESAYLLRGFMEQETTWKCNLKKYQPMASRKESAALQDTIDQYTTGIDEIFGDAIQDDIKKLVDDQQMSPFSGTERDKYKVFDVSTKIITGNLTIYGTVIAQSYYDLQTSLTADAVNYNITDNIYTTEDRSLSAWVMPRTIASVHKEYDVTSITLSTADASGLISPTHDIIVSSLTKFKADDTFVISRPGALNFYARVLYYDVNPLVYHCVIDTRVSLYLSSLVGSWMTQKGYKMMVKEPINIIDGINAMGDHVFTSNIYANQYIKINYAGQEYISILSDRLNDNEWYGVVVNIGNTWKQYNVYVWKKHDSDKNAKLQIVHYETITFIPADAAVTNFTINKSPAYLTNLRLYTATIEEEKQSTNLLSYFSSDADQAIILDNCNTKLLIPYYSRQR